jgi:proton glutamate symport protein
MKIKSFFNLLRFCRQPLVFLFVLLPFSMLIGYLLRGQAGNMRTLAMAGLSLYLLPSVPIVLCSITLAVDGILSVENERGFLLRLLLVTISLALGAALLGLISAELWHAGKLSEQAKMMLGEVVGEGSRVISVYIRTDSPQQLPEPLLNTFISWIVPNNLMMHLAKNETLKIISASLAFGITIRLIPSAMAIQLRLLLSGVNQMSTQLLSMLLDFSPVIIVLLLASSFSTMNFGVIFGLFSFIAAFLMAALFCLVLALILTYKRALPAGEGSPVIQQMRGRDEEKTTGSVHHAFDIFMLGISTASSISLYSSIHQLLRLWRYNEHQIDPAISTNLLVSRAGNIIFNMIAILFAINFYSESLSFPLMAKSVIFAILTGLASAGLSGIAVVPVITMALDALRIPSAPIILPLMAIDPILGMVRAGITGVVALSGATLICSKIKITNSLILVDGQN